MKRKLLSILLALAMCLSLLPTFALAATTYHDTSGHWAEDAIDRWSGYGVVNGKGAATFDPDGPMRRGEAAQMFANLLGLNKEGDISAYADAQGDWFTSAIAKCVAAGILNGRGDGVMDPNGLITREEFLTMYARAICISNGTDTTAAKTGLEQKGFADTAQVSDWAADAIGTLVDKGYVNGMTATEIAPQANINRASVMALLDQSVSTYVGKDSTETTVAAKSEGITLIANPAVTTVTGTADVVVVAAGAEQYDTATGEIEHNDIRVESAKMPVARVQGENITVTLALSTTAEDATVTETGVDSIIVIESTSEVKNAAVEAEGAKIIVKDGAKAESVTVAETAKSAAVETAKNATVGTLTIAAESATASVAGKVETVKVEETAKNATIDTKSTAKVETVENKAENTAVTGTGSVGEVKSSEDVKVETKNTKVENTSETKEIAVTDNKGKETKVETKTEGTTTTKPETTVNKQETTGGGGGGHSHSYATKWTYDETNHWHAATCEHTSEVSGKAAHIDEDEDGICDVCHYGAVFHIVGTDKYYKDLQTAMLSLTEDGQTLEFLQDYTLTSQTTSGLGVAKCTIDLNGKTLTASNTWKLSNTTYRYMTYEEYVSQFGSYDGTKEGYNDSPYPLGMTENPVDVTIKNGTYIVNGTSSGRIRFEHGSTGVFEDMTIKSSSETTTYQGLQTYATNDDGSAEKNCYTFKNCSIENVYLGFEGKSGSCNEYEIAFTDCQLDSTTSANGYNQINLDDYAYGKLTIDESEFTLVGNAGGGAANCFYVDTYLSYVNGNIFNVSVSNSTFSVSGNANPYAQRFMTYNSNYMDNSSITITNSTFKKDGKTVEPAIKEQAPTNKTLVWVANADAFKACYAEWLNYAKASPACDGYNSNNYYLVESDGYYFVMGQGQQYASTATITMDGNSVVSVLSSASYGTTYNIIGEEDISTQLGDADNTDVHIYTLAKN